MTHLVRKIKWGVLGIGDLLVLYLALFATLKIRFGASFDATIWQQHLLPFSLLYLLWITIFYIFGLYDLRLARNDISFYSALLKALGLSVLLSVAFFYLIPVFDVAPKTNLALNTIMVLLFFSVWRQFYNFFIKYPALAHDIIIIGKHSQTKELQDHITKNPQLGYRTAAIIDPSPEQFSSLKLGQGTYTLLSAFSTHEYPRFTRLLFENISRFAFEDFSSFYERITGKIPISQINEVWFLGNVREQDKRFYEVTKRAVDIVAALALGAVMLTLFPFIALAIKLETPGPILYKQQRVGKNGTTFSFLKFRSMKEGAEQNGAVWAQKNDPRITKTGTILRKTFLDELPQCMNILQGEMSFTGPRPERPEFVQELEQEIPFYQIRHIIKPGVTGWAQTNFQYGNSTEDALEKLQYELYYIKNRSFILDFKIVLKTLNILFKGGTQ